MKHTKGYDVMKQGESKSVFQTQGHTHIHTYKFEQRAHRHEDREVVEALGTTAMQRTRSLFCWMVFPLWSLFPI
jgi:hypothetical protein